MSRSSWAPRRHRRGQALVEFCLVLPIIITLVLATAEMGVAIGTNMSLELATREGARVGAALVNGGGQTGCGGGQSPNWASVDPQIIASVERALTSRGSGIDLNRVDWIHIFKANAGGGEDIINVWEPGPGPTVDGVALHFYQASAPWQACTRSSALPPPSIGVSVRYHYRMFTPLAVFTGMFGVGEITMTDKTVMALEPGQ